MSDSTPSTTNFASVKLIASLIPNSVVSIVTSNLTAVLVPDGSIVTSKYPTEEGAIFPSST